MLTSLYFSVASSHRPPGAAVGGMLASTFSEEREEVNRTSTNAYALEKAKLVTSRFRARADKLDGIPRRHYRYEDVVFEKLSWVWDMVDYLGLMAPAALVERVVAANDVRFGPIQRRYYYL